MIKRRHGDAEGREYERREEIGQGRREGRRGREKRKEDRGGYLGL